LPQCPPTDGNIGIDGGVFTGVRQLGLGAFRRVNLLLPKGRHLEERRFDRIRRLVSLRTTNTRTDGRPRQLRNAISHGAGLVVDLLRALVREF
jgi:hypothetical protein